MTFADFIDSLTARDVLAVAAILACTYLAGIVTGIAARSMGGRGSRRADFPPRTVIRKA